MRKHVRNFEAPNVKMIIAAILENEDVNFLWCVVSADWDQSSAWALLRMIVQDWVNIRGLSLASAWVESSKSLGNRLPRNPRE